MNSAIEWMVRAMWEDFGSRQGIFSQGSIQCAVQDAFPTANYQQFSSVLFYHVLENTY